MYSLSVECLEACSVCHLEVGGNVLALANGMPELGKTDILSSLPRTQLPEASSM